MLRATYFVAIGLDRHAARQRDLCHHCPGDQTRFRIEVRNLPSLHASTPSPHAAARAQVLGSHFSRRPFSLSLDV